MPNGDTSYNIKITAEADTAQAALQKTSEEANKLGTSTDATSEKAKSMGQSVDLLAKSLDGAGSSATSTARNIDALHTSYGQHIDDLNTLIQLEQQNAAAQQGASSAAVDTQIADLNTLIQMEHQNAAANEASKGKILDNSNALLNQGASARNAADGVKGLTEDIKMATGDVAAMSMALSRLGMYAALGAGIYEGTLKLIEFTTGLKDAKGRAEDLKKEMDSLNNSLAVWHKLADYQSNRADAAFTDKIKANIAARSKDLQGERPIETAQGTLSQTQDDISAIQRRLVQKQAMRDSAEQQAEDVARRSNNPNLDDVAKDQLKRQFDELTSAIEEGDKDIKDLRSMLDQAKAQLAPANDRFQQAVNDNYHDLRRNPQRALDEWSQPDNTIPTINGGGMGLIDYQRIRDQYQAAPASTKSDLSGPTAALRDNAGKSADNQQAAAENIAQAADLIGQNTSSLLEASRTLAAQQSQIRAEIARMQNQFASMGSRATRSANAS